MLSSGCRSISRSICCSMARSAALSSADALVPAGAVALRAVQRLENDSLRLQELNGLAAWDPGALAHAAELAAVRGELHSGRRPRRLTPISSSRSACTRIAATTTGSCRSRMSNNCAEYWEH
eukprot:1347038-Pyramimonas_sp.AAC.1